MTSIAPVTVHCTLQSWFRTALLLCMTHRSLRRTLHCNASTLRRTWQHPTVHQRQRRDGGRVTPCYLMHDRDRVTHCCLMHFLTPAQLTHKPCSCCCCRCCSSHGMSGIDDVSMLKSCHPRQSGSVSITESFRASIRAMSRGRVRVRCAKHSPHELYAFKTQAFTMLVMGCWCQKMG